MVGCDLYDLGGHLTLEGGDLKTLTPAGNYVRNNHFTQVESRDLYGRVRIRGVGNVFQNNLVHNFVGQPITVGGNDHRGRTQRDIQRRHRRGRRRGHLLRRQNVELRQRVPAQFPAPPDVCRRRPIPAAVSTRIDLDAGDTIVENMFYKAAHRAVLLNGGAAHVVKQTCSSTATSAFTAPKPGHRVSSRQKPKYDSGELKRGDKNDHIWRTEQVVGKEGWNRPPWSTKYPLFKKVMNQPADAVITRSNARLRTICSAAITRTPRFASAGAKDGWQTSEDVDYITAAENRDIPLDAFVDPACLDFRFKQGKRPEGFPEIPFDQIGLVVGPYRKHVPDQAAYRRVLKAKWDDRKSYDEKAVYDPKTITELIYFNTGKLLFSANR